MTAKTASAIYASLKPLGLTRAQARRLLPEWWSAEMEASPSGVAELSLLLARRLSLDIHSLSVGEAVHSNQQFSVAFKHRAGSELAQLRASTAIATSLGSAISAAMEVPTQVIPESASSFAGLIRQRAGSVGLASLVDACWSLGVPVIPMPNLPVGVRKMDGAALNLNGRKAIVVSRKRSSRSWLAFIVAHEIGHLAKGHLTTSGAIVDIALQEQATHEVESSADLQEQEADQYALELMGGEKVESVIRQWPSHSSAIDLAVGAKQNALDCGVEPGHLILRFAFKTKRWSEAVSALNFLREDADADTVMLQALQRNIDLGRVADDLRDFIQQVTGAV